MKHYNLLSIFLVIAGCYSAVPEKTGKEGQLMPEFKLLLTDSITWKSTNGPQKEESTVLFYFSPNCPYCKAQTKLFLQNMDKLKNIHFYFATTFPTTMIKEYSNEFELSKYPNITIGMDVSQTLGDYFEIPGVPYTAIYGKDKKLRKSFLGGKIHASQINEIAEE